MFSYCWTIKNQSESVIKMIKKETFQFKTSDGAHIHGEVRGVGPTLILIYGIACQVNHWVHQVNELSKYFQVVTYDLRGHIKSSMGAADRLNIAGLTDDLYELLQYLDVPQAHLAGHSFGAPVVIEFAARYPAHVQSISLINGFIQNPLDNFMGINLPKLLLPHLKGLTQEDPKVMQTLWAKFIDNPLSMMVAGLTGGFNLKVTQFKDIEIYTRGVAHLDLNVFLPLFESLINYSGQASAHKIQAPTLIIGGEKDQITPLPFQKEMHLAIPNSDFKIVPYGSHCCQLDFPDYINLLIKQHIDKAQLTLFA